MSVGQTISGFEFDLTDFDYQELIKGITPKDVVYDGDYNVKLWTIVEDESGYELIAVMSMPASEDGSGTAYALRLDEGYVWNSIEGVVSGEADKVKEISPVKIVKIANAEILAKYIGAKA